jgi:lysophospholipase L1-like esterase
VLLSSAQAITHLRILPLGDSITWGYGSSTGSGYRAPLLTLLTSPNSSFTPSTTNITYIGTVTSGTLPPPNNANEGHSGALISQIGDYAKVPLSWNGSLQGNIVLLMAGTNDMFNARISPDGAPERLGALIDEIVTAWPKAAVLVATLTPSATNTTQDNIEIFNGQVAGIVSKRAKAGNRTLVVSMSKVTVGMEYDGLHPNDLGYTVMAQAWYKGLLEAKTKGWVLEVASGAAMVAGVGWLVGLSTVLLTLLVTL